MTTRLIILFAIACGVGVHSASAQDTLPATLGLGGLGASYRTFFKTETAVFERLDQFAYRPPADGCQGKRSELWSNFDLTYANQKQTSSNSPYSEWGSTGVYGLDTHPSRDTIIGIHLAATLAENRSPLWDASLRERDTLTNFITSLYAIRYNAAWSLKGIIGYGYNDYKTELLGQSERRDGHAYHAAAEIARRFRFGQSILSPYYSFATVGQEEKSQPKFGVDKRRTHRYLQTVGARLGRDVFLNRGWILYPHLDVAWRHNYNAETWSLAFDGESFARLTPARDLAVVTGGLNLIVSDSLWMYTRYEVEWADRYYFQILTGGFVWTF